MMRLSRYAVPLNPFEDAADAARVKFSVVVPVYGNASTLELLISRLSLVAERLDGPLEIVFVVDGSPDDSLATLRRLLPSAPVPTQLVVHSRNFGSFAAIRTGLMAASGDYVAVMAADLQEPPELMEEFFGALADGKHDVAVGRRVSRADPAMTSAMSRVFWGTYRRLINPDIPPGGVDVFAVSKPAADELLRLHESHSSLIGLLFWIGYDRVEVPYDRLERPDGKSGWTIRKRTRYLLDSVFSFTDIPISMLSTVGAMGALTTVAIAIIVFVSWATGGIKDVGYTPLMLVLLFSTFSLLSGLGVVGSYVWRTYENSKARPWAIPISRERFNGK
jgi:glycosyltransferase involved in cell wall biosynthesis